MNRDRPSYRVYRPGIHDSYPPTSRRASAPPPPKAGGATVFYLLAIATLIAISSMGAVRFVRADRYAPANAQPAPAVPLPGSTEPISVVDPATMPSVRVDLVDAGVVPKPEKPKGAPHRFRRVPAANGSADTPPPNPYPEGS